MLETNGQDQTNPEDVTVASVSPSALLKAKICSRNSKNIDRRNCYWYRHIMVGYRYPYFWHKVPSSLQNVVPGTLLWHHGRAEASGGAGGGAPPSKPFVGNVALLSEVFSDFFVHFC